MTGAVYEITNAADKEELKPILSAADVFPPYLSPEALKLCSFLKSHTLCTFGEAVRCVLPSGAVSKMAEYYRIAPSVSEDDCAKILSGMNEKAVFVYTTLRSSKRLSKESLRAKFGDDVGAILTRLIKHGIVEKCDEFRRGGENVLKITKVYPASSTESDIPKMRSERQAVILSTVMRVPGNCECRWFSYPFNNLKVEFAFIC